MGIGLGYWVIFNKFYLEKYTFPLGLISEEEKSVLF